MLAAEAAWRAKKNWKLDLKFLVVRNVDSSYYGNSMMIRTYGDDSGSTRNDGSSEILKVIETIVAVFMMEASAGFCLPSCWMGMPGVRRLAFPLVSPCLP